MIIGTNRDEATLFVRKEKTKFPNSWAMIEEMFDKTGNVHALPHIRAYYEAKESPFVAFASDYAFLVPSLAFAKAQSKHGNVYVYRYDYISQTGAKNGLKAAHAFEMSLVFATTQSEWGRAIFGEDAPQTVAQLVYDMHDVWVNFTRDGRVQVKDWQAFSDYKALSTYVIDTHSQCQTIDYQELMTLWSDLHFYAD